MRLARTGAKKRPSYRVVIADAGAPRDGRAVDILGFYNPLTHPATVRIDAERARDWLRKGAQPSDRVHLLLVREGIIPGRRPREEAAPEEAPTAPRPALGAALPAAGAPPALAEVSAAAAPAVASATEVKPAAPAPAPRRRRAPAAAADPIATPEPVAEAGPPAAPAAAPARRRGRAAAAGPEKTAATPPVEGEQQP